MTGSRGVIFFFNVILPCDEQVWLVTFKKQCRAEDALVNCLAVFSLCCMMHNHMGSLEEGSRHNFFVVEFSNKVPYVWTWTHRPVVFKLYFSGTLKPNQGVLLLKSVLVLFF